MGSVEGTTMAFIAEQLWHWDRDNQYIGVKSNYYWDNLSDVDRRPWYERAVMMIDTAEPIWRARVKADPGARAGWTAAVEHLEGCIGGELKRAAHLDNPYHHLEDKEGADDVE
jgi:hypothetical protein